MPEASLGGTGDRDNTRPPGAASPNVPRFRGDDVAPGDVRIYIANDGGVTFMTAANTFPDRVIEMRAEYDRYTYTCQSGRSFSVSGAWRSGDTIPQTDITWVRTPQMRQQYVAGGYIAPTQYYAAPVCECEVCQQDRAQRPVMPVATQWDSEEQRREFREWQDRELQERRELVARRRAEQEARQAKVAARAEETLRMVLLPKELKHYDKTDQIIITGGDGKRYEIRSGLINNVVLLAGTRGDRPLASLCCHPNLYPNGSEEQLPILDAHIGQILYLRHDIDKFYRTANITWMDLGARDEYLARRAADRTLGGQPYDWWDT